MPERWLVIGHEATNSGAPRVLLRVLQGVRAKRGGDWSCEMLFRYGGHLLGEFAALGSVHILAHPWAHGRTVLAGMIRRFWDRPWRQPHRFARWLDTTRESRYDLVYNNTATNAYLVSGARQFGCPILTHVHELAGSLRRFNSPAELAATLESSDHFLTPSTPAADDLVACGVAREDVTVVPNFLPELPREPDGACRAAARRELGVSDGVRLVVGCGHIDRVKGTDLFVEMAARLLSRSVEAWQFVWLGGVTDTGFARRLGTIIRQRGLTERVELRGAVRDPSAWFKAADLVAVTSREESFSLVALEAAALARPVVGFRGSRGLASILGERPDLLAPEFDLAALAARVDRLLADAGNARNTGLQLRARVVAEFRGGKQIERILSVTDTLRARRSKIG